MQGVEYSFSGYETDHQVAVTNLVGYTMDGDWVLHAMRRSATDPFNFVIVFFDKEFG